MSTTTTRCPPAPEAVELPTLLQPSRATRQQLEPSKASAREVAFGPVTIGKVSQQEIGGEREPFSALAPEPAQKTAAASVPAERLDSTLQAALTLGDKEDAFWTAAARALRDKERLEAVGAFLKQHGFGGVNHAVGWITRYYPLHIAVEQADAKMVQLLLESDAKRRVYDSSGLTPLQLARTRNASQGSHEEVLRVFDRHSEKKAADKRRRRAEAAAGAAPTAQGRLAACSSAPAPTARKRSSMGSTTASSSQDAEVQCSLAEGLKTALEEERALRLAAEEEARDLRLQVESLLTSRAGAEGL